jgi:hypothetical protein
MKRSLSRVEIYIGRRIDRNKATGGLASRTASQA